MDVKNCLRHLELNGTIIFHDCNPQSEEAGSPKLPRKPIIGVMMFGKRSAN